MNMFEVATRSKLRFPYKGQISVEDLWDLSVQSLDLIYKFLNSNLKQIQEESLLEVKSKKDEELELKIEIVKYIVKIKLEEQNARATAKKNKEQKQKLLEVLAAKQDAELHSKSAEELQKMLDEMD